MSAQRAHSRGLRCRRKAALLCAWSGGCSEAHEMTVAKNTSCGKSVILYLAGPEQPDLDRQRVSPLLSPLRHPRNLSSSFAAWL
eukprot:1933676-Rhodomonas_salina.1